MMTRHDDHVSLMYVVDVYDVYLYRYVSYVYDVCVVCVHDDVAAM